MEAHEICEKFIAADTFYDGKNANITLEEISKQPKFKEYCNNQKCNTRKEIIGALGAYLFMDTRRMKNSGQYDEFFLMWLSDKLFEIVNDENKAQSKDITLNEAYDKYLKNNIQNGHYWSLLDSTKGLKEANIKYMRDLYKLLNHICSTILDYKNNGAKSTSLFPNSTNCSNQYILIYKNIYKCKSYLHLLDNLKKIYYSFRDSVISENKKKKQNLAIPLQTLTTPKGKDEYFANDFKAFDFSSSECKPKKPKKPGSPKKGEQPPLPLPLKGTPPVAPIQPSNLPKNNQGEKQSAQQTPTSSQNSDELQKTKTGGLIHQNGSDDSKDKPQDSENSKGTTGDTPDNKGNSNIENRSSEGRSGDGSSGSGSPGDGSGGGSGGGSSGGPGSPGGGKDSGGGAPGIGANDGLSGGSKTPMDQTTTHSSGASDGYLSNLWRTHLSPMNYIPSIPDIYETPKNILASTANKITSAYSNTVDNIKYAYDRTVDSVTSAYNSAVTNITNAYTTSTNYISGAVSSITNQLSSLGSFSQLGDDQPELGGSGNSLSTENNPPSTTQVPKPDPNSSSLPPPLPQSPSPSVTSLPSQPQSNQTHDSSQDPPQAPLQDPSSQKKLSSTHDSQDKVQNGASNIVQQPDPNTGAGVQTMTITKATLPSSSTGPSSTWNGSTIGTIVKMSEKSSIWCIGSNKKCDVLSIGIISISIFAFLTIMYKYISFGSAKNSKKKKSMKRVIKYGDGKRKTQIIIKSYDRNKDLKPVINSVGRKKYPTLNIYKLMQADPVPFINVFFLLIFFVYKKNYII
ncbi:PIR protein CIR protein [Plasmodium vinckei]|uniref:PIR protein CIR protein n=1 Tax=Plasmodium vinckei TaxID=5860 RepID=A0A6V7S9H6_PLAVN|nr:PIR protein CIR protein [Plasmodium vinckei]